MLVRFFITIYFLIPKIDLFYLPGSLTGIRVQDIIVLLLVLTRGSLPKIVLKPILILGLCIFGNVISNLPVQFIMGSFRILEYSILGFYIFEYIIRREKTLKQFMLIIITFNLIISVLQFQKIIPNFDPGRGLLLSSQFSGFYGTPAELSYMFVCLIYILILTQRSKLLKFNAMFPIFNGVLLGGMVILILGPLLAVLKKLGKKIFVPFAFVVTTCLLVYISVIFGKIFNDFVDVVVAAQPTLSEIKLSPLSLDGYASLAQRLGKWANSIAYLIDHPMSALIGVGIYSQGGALDGGLLRLIFEFGILLSAYILYCIWKADIRFLLLFVCVNLMFDAYMSSVVAPLLFGIYFYHLTNRKLQCQ